jgi:hypothetical protein
MNTVLSNTSGLENHSQNMDQQSEILSQATTSKAFNQVDSNQLNGFKANSTKSVLTSESINQFNQSNNLQASSLADNYIRASSSLIEKFFFIKI